MGLFSLIYSEADCVVEFFWVWWSVLLRGSDYGPVNVSLWQLRYPGYLPGRD